MDNTEFQFFLEVDEEVNTDFVRIVGCLSIGGFRPVGITEHHGHIAIMYYPIPKDHSAKEWINWLVKEDGLGYLKEKGLELVECGKATESHLLYRIKKESN